MRARNPHALALRRKLSADQAAIGMSVTRGIGDRKSKVEWDTARARYFGRDTNKCTFAT